MEHGAIRQKPAATGREANSLFNVRQRNDPHRPAPTTSFPRPGHCPITSPALDAPPRGGLHDAGKKDADKADKHDCKGKNDCKGKGGCKTSDNGCKGKNSCKGKGGCATNKEEKKDTDKKVSLIRA